MLLFALGAAIPRCCDLALAVSQHCAGRIVLAVTTDTVDVIDDFVPLEEVC